MSASKPFAGEVVVIQIAAGGGDKPWSPAIYFYHGGVQVSASEAKELEEGGASLTFDQTRTIFGFEK